MTDKPLKVLILEDSVDDAELLVSELEKSGYLLEWKRVDNESAYHIALDSQPDVIISDSALPGYSGEKALVYRNEHAKDIPFILVSGMIGEELAVTMIKKGADDYLLKDRLGRLGEAVKQVLENKEVQQALVESEKALFESRFNAELIVRASADAIISIDSEQKIILFNPAAEAMFGMEQSEAIGKHVEELLPQRVRITHANYVQLFIQKGTNTRTMGHQEVIYGLRTNGQEFPIEATISQFESAAGSINTVIIRDITKRKQAEEIIKQYASELERRVEERTIELVHANRAKDEFLATMSHELRTPLNSVLGFSESLLEQRRGPLNEKQEQYVNLINSSGQHLLGLINDILEVSKIEAGKLELHPDIISVKEVCESSLNFIKEIAVKKSIRVEFKNESSISSLRADSQRLKQILVNLLSNAVKFTPEKGKVSLDVQVNDEKDQIQFSVTDNGIGIAQGNLPKLFIPFSQIDSSLSRQYEGTGLGLALVLKLTELHGGSVKVESKPGMGSTFTINLPWSEGQSIKTERDAKSVLPIIVVDEPVTIDGQPAKILLAEDNMSNVLTIKEYLSDHGYDVIVAHDRAEAIAMAEESSPNIILMDIQMPVSLKELVKTIHTFLAKEE